MSINMKVDGAWLTVNRFCNFRCSWCYAGLSDKTSNMDYALAGKLIDICADVGVQTVILIGGEPTFWPYFFPTIEYIHAKNMKSSLVTNGCLLSKERFMEKVKESGLSFISLSLKAGNELQHEKLTKTKAFLDVCKGIRTASKSEIKTDVSITISSLVAENLTEIARVAADNGAKSLSLQFCTPIFDGIKPIQGYALSPRQTVEIITKVYREIEKIQLLDIWIEQSLPRCIWPKDFLSELEAKGQIGFGCHVNHRDGIIFDPKGSVIPCNCLSNIEIAEYGVDYFDVDSLKTHWQSSEVVDFYDRFAAYPDKKCASCLDYDACGGGCPLNWFAFEPSQVLSI